MASQVLTNNTQVGYDPHDWVAVEDRIPVAVMHDKAGHKICTDIMRD